MCSTTGYASIIEEVETSTGVYTFSHALVRHTLYEDMSTSRRRMLHRRVGEALEELFAVDPGDRLGELALHWCEATQPADIEKALRFSLLAGDAAVAALASDEAVRWYGQALTLIGETDRRRADVMVRLGEARRDAGSAETNYRELLVQAVHVAMEFGDEDALVHTVWPRPLDSPAPAEELDEGLVQMLEAALDAVGDERSARRSVPPGLLAVELVSQPDPTRRETWRSADAVSIARDVGRRELLADVLSMRHSAIASPATLAERLASTADCLDLTVRLRMSSCGPRAVRPGVGMHGCGAHG